MIPFYMSLNFFFLEKMVLFCFAVLRVLQVFFGQASFNNAVILQILAIWCIQAVLSTIFSELFKRKFSLTFSFNHFYLSFFASMSNYWSVFFCATSMLFFLCLSRYKNFTTFFLFLLFSFGFTLKTR